ncbi:MAG: hypothetical protein BWX70_02884 [Verrucomicrobia bacterium ADurb.Bin070]|nr:MAG: hypothetical protein BWX70_02884 [Verrucomicrobia bacterium ADurb.Bin070]
MAVTITEANDQVAVGYANIEGAAEEIKHAVVVAAGAAAQEQLACFERSVVHAVISVAARITERGYIAAAGGRSDLDSAAILGHCTGRAFGRPGQKSGHAGIGRNRDGAAVIAGAARGQGACAERGGAVDIERGTGRSAVDDGCAECIGAGVGQGERAVVNLERRAEKVFAGQGERVAPIFTIRMRVRQIAVIDQVAPRGVDAEAGGRAGEQGVGPHVVDRRLGPAAGVFGGVDDQRAARSDRHVPALLMAGQSSGLEDVQQAVADGGGARVGVGVTENKRFARAVLDEAACAADGVREGHAASGTAVNK